MNTSFFLNATLSYGSELVIIVVQTIMITLQAFDRIILPAGDHLFIAFIYTEIIEREVDCNMQNDRQNHINSSDENVVFKALGVTGYVY